MDATDTVSDGATTSSQLSLGQTVGARSRKPFRAVVDFAQPAEEEKDDAPRRLTQGMNVLSWDCGISNLCYCLLEEETGGKRDFRIVMWENFSLNSQTLMQAVSMLVRELDRRPWMMDVDYVCIEAQTLKNVQMKVVSHAIQCYFESRGEERAKRNGVVTALPNGTKVMRKGHGGPPVNFIKPENKFKINEGIRIPDAIEALTRRRRNKKAAVYLADQLLRNKHEDPTALNFLNSFEKQDDLSDSFLQGIYFLRLMQKKREQNERLQKYLGVNNKEKPRTVLEIEDTTGTKDERFDEGVNINEGCEYEKEVPLPQVYRCKHFVVPTYDEWQGTISHSTKFLRKTCE